MLTREDNELLCRIGPEASMGKMVRRYWLPAAMSSELEADGAPKRVRLMGEDLVGFRDSNGRAGLLEELCPHRGVSLTLARNEECGLRCLYHGWKFDVSGKILDMPTELEPQGFIDRVRAVAYPVRESGGIVWAYLGPAGTQPPPPDFEFTTFPDVQNVIVKARIDCNWVQCLEGVIDSAHTNYLHADTFKPAPGLANSVYRDESLLVARPSSDGRPRFEVEDTEYGFRYAAIRRPLVDADKDIFVRTTLFIAPFHGLFAGQAGWGSHQAFVPIDDEHTMLYFVRYNLTRPVDDEERKRHAAWSGLTPGVDIDGEFRKFRNRENDWQQDRAAMQLGTSYSGVKGVQMEDAVVQESMGRIYDRSKEHLGTGDAAVVRMRRLMLQSLRGFLAGDGPPLGLAAPVDHSRLRATEAIIPIGTPWQSLGASAPAQ
jgi:phthalate 4,5-dioxygenase oxygenase subunit